MPGRPTVKARQHHGAPSLDLTLPAQVRAECGVKAGDVFAVTAECRDGGEIVITYTRVRVPAGDGDGGGRPRRG